MVLEFCVLISIIAKTLSRESCSRELMTFLARARSSVFRIYLCSWKFDDSNNRTNDASLQDLTFSDSP
jgi:hypothetical protein